MFQDFSSSSDPALGRERMARLRARLDRLGVDAVLVPRSDEHMGEYVPPSAERLAWLTGFTGSAGLAAIGAKKAALFVDGRYTLQAADQVDTTIFEIMQIPEADPRQWLADNLPKGARVGFDPWLHTRAAMARFEEAFAKSGLVLKALPRNPVDPSGAPSARHRRRDRSPSSPSNGRASAPATRSSPSRSSSGPRVRTPSS
jgi:Xaa-Pro aminopeptidase